MLRFLTASSRLRKLPAVLTFKIDIAFANNTNVFVKLVAEEWPVEG